MALETASYIADLVATNPTASDPISQGDDHTRMLKSALQKTFAGFPGMVIVTGAETQGASASDYTLSVSPAPAAYTAGMLMLFKSTHTNVAAATLQINTLGSKPLLDVAGGALLAGTIAAGALVLAYHDGTSMYCISANALQSVPTPAAGDNSTRPANTAMLARDYAPLIAPVLQSPVLSGAPLAPTVALGNNSTQVATTAFVMTALANIGLAVPTTFNAQSYVSDITANPASAGVFDLYNLATSGTQTVTLPGGTMTPGLAAVSVNDIGGGSTQVVSPNGVYVNLPKSTTASYGITNKKFAVLLNNTVSQGVWNNGATYGLSTPLAVPGGTGAGNAAFLSISASQMVIAWAAAGYGQITSPVCVMIYNPLTGVYGATVTLASVYALNKIYIYRTGVNGFAVFGAESYSASPGDATGVACTVTGSVITTGTATRATAPAGQLGSGCALSASTIVFAHVGTLATQILAATVSGTTITWGVPQPFPGTAAATPSASVVALTSTTGVAMTSYAGTSQLIAFSVSGTTATFGAPVSLSNLADVIFPSGVAGGVVALKCTGSGFAATAATAATISGTTVTAGSAATISVTGQVYIGGNTITFPILPGIGGGLNNAMIGAYGGSQFFYAGLGIVPWSVSGTTITVGTAVLPSSSIYASVAPDGTWGYLDTTGDIGLFSITANTVTLGTVICTTAAQVAAGLPFNNAPFESYSSTHMFGRILINGTWYPYFGGRTAVGSGNPKFTIGTTGAALVVASNSAAFFQSKFK